jgi:hypothetical protein
VDLTGDRDLAVLGGQGDLRELAVAPDSTLGVIVRESFGAIASTGFFTPPSVQPASTSTATDKAMTRRPTLLTLRV